jgi:hypothetical protein
MTPRLAVWKALEFMILAVFPVPGPDVAVDGFVRFIATEYSVVWRISRIT